MKNVNHITGKMEVDTSVFPGITSIKAYHDLNPDVLEARIARQSSWCHPAFDCCILLCARCQRKQAQDNNNCLGSHFILAVCFSPICSSLTLLLRITPLLQPDPRSSFCICSVAECPLGYGVLCIMMVCLVLLSSSLVQ